jgi:hypothetical protein
MVNDAATTFAFDQVAAHVVATLPPEIELRKRVLQSLIRLMDALPATNPRHDDIKQLLSYLQHHEILAVELSHKLSQS